MALPAISTVLIHQNSSTGTSFNVGIVDTSFSEIHYQPKTIALYNREFYGLKTNSILSLNLEISNGLYIVSDNVFCVYGDGDTEEKALDDYLLSLYDFYQMLEESAKRRKEDKAQFSFLQKYISRV